MTIDWDNGTETCDFWVGVFADEDSFFDYVGERADYHDDLTGNPAIVSVPLVGNPVQSSKEPLSRFIGDQGHQWYDHDLMESGFLENADSVAELIDGYSYSDQYADELTSLAAAAGVRNPNAFLFIRSGEIQKPKSVKTNEFEFHYVGKITYNL